MLIHQVERPNREVHILSGILAIMEGLQALKNGMSALGQERSSAIVRFAPKADIATRLDASAER